MFEKDPKLSAKRSQRQKVFKNKPKQIQSTFVALRDGCEGFSIGKLYDSFGYDIFQNYGDFNSASFMRRSIDERAMTRKTRSRQPRIHRVALQSGYCAICHLHYNSLEEHIQSKKHLKLIGDDANFISLNGFIDQDASFSSLLNCNGIGISINCKNIDSDYSPRPKKNKMQRNRTISVCETVKQAPLSPPRSDKGHHLRSRKQINYASPVIEEDSLPEKPEKHLKTEEKDFKEKRSSTRLLAVSKKLVDQENTEVWNSGRPKRSCIRQKRMSIDQFDLAEQENEEVWNSGRPKRACIRQKRISLDDASDLDQENDDLPLRHKRSSIKSKRASADERLVTDNRTYYKVEVMSSKLRSSGATNHKEPEVVVNSRRTLSPPNNKQDKALIVKFKKLRNSELRQLNNEAENFLFPKKDESSSEDDPDTDGAGEATFESGKNNDSTLLLSDFEEVKSPKFKHENDESMDSNYSEGKRKKKRRTHAEVFINDNQKYYKFETPGSRLRYQGTFLPQPEIVTKHNGDCLAPSKCDIQEVELTDRKEFNFNLDNYKFSFERKPKSEPWYQTFERQDTGDENYIYYNDEDYWNPFLLPYQIGYLPPMDPKICFSQYQQVKKILQEPTSSSSSGGTTTPDPTASGSGSNYDPEEDEDSKLSATTTELSSEDATEPNDKEEKVLKRKFRRPKVYSGGGKNPRKSPRQHASTLAILSSLIHQRKKRAKSADSSKAATALTPIPEEQLTPQPVRQPQTQPKREIVRVTPPKYKRSPGRPPRVDYNAILRNIDDEITNSFDPELDDLDSSLVDGFEIFNAKTTAMDVLQLYDECKAKEDFRSARRFFNGTPGRKPGRKKKKNRTGWPRNNNRRCLRKVKDEDLDDSTIDSASVNADSDDLLGEDTNSTDYSIKKDFNKLQHSANGISKNDQSSLSDVDHCDLVERDNNRVSKRHGSESTQSETKSASDSVIKGLQPVVRVQKLDSTFNRDRTNVSPKRTNVRQRRMPASPKSPRMLRKPRGRWYRER